MINSLSAILSALTILSFWTITHIARKVVINSEKDYTLGNIVAILGAGTVGALVYTFSDSFGSGCGRRSLCIFVVLYGYCILLIKWERVADVPAPDRC